MGYPPGHKKRNKKEDGTFHQRNTMPTVLYLPKEVGSDCGGGGSVYQNANSFIHDEYQHIMNLLNKESSYAPVAAANLAGIAGSKPSMVPKEQNQKLTTVEYDNSHSKDANDSLYEDVTAYQK